MGCFPACFTSSNLRKHRKAVAVAVAPSTQHQHQHQIVEATGEEAVRFEYTRVDDIVIPSTEFNVVEEQTKNDAKEKKVTFDLVRESIDEKRAETPKEVELILNHRYENCSNSEDENEGMIDLSGSDLNGGDDGESVEVESNKEIVVQEQESSESLFSISIDSRKRVSDAEEDEKEVNSPMPKPKPLENSNRSQHCHHSVLSPIENPSEWKELKAKAYPLASKNQEKENVNAEQDFNIPISPEPTLQLSKDFTRRPLKANDLKLGDQETAVDTSLSSRLVECETTPKSNASDNSEGVSSSKRLGDRLILGEWTREELKEFSNSSTPNQSRRADQIPNIGTVGSYWSHTGQATDSDSNFLQRKGKYSREEQRGWKGEMEDRTL